MLQRGFSVLCVAQSQCRPTIPLQISNATLRSVISSSSSRCTPESYARASGSYTDDTVHGQDNKVNQGGSVLCGWCEDAKAAVQCMDCKSPYCESCAESTHTRPAFRNHKATHSLSMRMKTHTYRKRHQICRQISAVPHGVLGSAHQRIIEAEGTQVQRAR